MNKERDKFLTESMGECWHEWKRSCGCCPGYCKKCSADESLVENNDFSEWEDFGKLFLWAKQQDWWDTLFWQRDSKEILHTYDVENLIHPDHFADAVYAFLKGRA